MHAMTHPQKPVQRPESEKLPGTIRGWFLPTCTVPGCNRPKPLFTQICNFHAGPKDEGYPFA